MPSALGDLLVDSGIYLVSIYGGTEFGPVTHVFRRKGEERDWQYLEYSDTVNVRWDPQGDGTFEAQYLVCLSDSSVRPCLIVYRTPADLKKPSTFC